MTFPGLSDTLSSIFHSPDSVYASLDHSATLPPPHSSSSVPPHPLINSTHEHDDDDPFSAVTPSVLSPVKVRVPLPRKGDDSDEPHLSSPITDDQLQLDHEQKQDGRDPFHSEPLASSTTVHERDLSGSLEQTPTSSIYLPPQSPPTTSLSPPASSIYSAKTGQGLGTSSGTTSAGSSGGGIGGKSVMGNRSLMGLLGGTRTYERGGRYPFGGVGVGEEEEDLDEDEEDESFVAQKQGRERETLRTLAASLPPPPSSQTHSRPRSRSSSRSSVSSRSSTVSEPDAPPDYTTRIPLISSVHHSHHDQPRDHSSPSPSHRGPRGGLIASGLSAKERALWRWVNTEDLDGFLKRVYEYYVGKGIWTIGLDRGVKLLTVGWVIFFSTFLLGCIDYSRIYESHRLSEVVIPRCASRLSGFTLLLSLTFAFFYLWRVFRFSVEVRKLWEMKEFYEELLEVPESDIQTIPWPSIVTRLSALRASHPSALSSRSSSSTAHPATSSSSAERLDAHDIANRIMRAENYLIALFNKSLLDTSLPLPLLLQKPAGWIFGPDIDKKDPDGRRRRDGRKKRLGKNMLTKVLEWNLDVCLMGVLFGRDGQVRRGFLSERNRGELVEGLKRRFILMGLINAVFAPFIVVYLLLYSFFRYFEEYHKNPTTLSTRNFTPLAGWKFREFNELPHHFHHRLLLARPLADAYLSQYPKAKTALVSRFIAFLAGSFAAVLILFSLIDPDAFLHFEITEGRTVVFWIGILGAVVAAARGMGDEGESLGEGRAGERMRELVEVTGYEPREWRGRLHSAEVHVSFSKLFPLKISLFCQEILSVLITPLVLWYTLPNCAGEIVDFFREFTVHVDGLGYVCSFAVFDFKRHGDPNFGAPTPAREEEVTQSQPRSKRYRSTEGKMEKSFLNFAAHNPTWQPRDATQSLFLSQAQLGPSSSSLRPPPSSGPGNGGAHLHSSVYHSRHPSTSSALRQPHSHSHAHRTALHNRFSSVGAGGGTGSVLPEEEGEGLAPESSSTTVDERRRSREDKARLHDRAFQPSALLGTSSITSSSLGGAINPFSVPGHSGLNLQPHSHPRSRLNPATHHHQHHHPSSYPTNLNPNEPERIEEESALGDSFVAPTSSQPFGFSSSPAVEGEEEAGGVGVGEESVERMNKLGLRGLARELYHR
ncbi:hypothetical protein JCM11641_006897 [Rhodosporidiobolus odoratus]